MTKLALSDEILMKIDKPARYIGNELNSVVKEKDTVDIRFVMCFPDVYEIGMSHLGIQILYDMLNKREDVWCERVYSPWSDLHAILKEENIPLFSLESQQPVKDADFLGRRFRCLRWNRRIRSRILTFLESRSSMRCVIPISYRS